jgi:O-methyltransferase
MAGKVVRRMLRPLRRLAARILSSERENYTGEHGCIRTAASFVTWNQVEGDYLEFGVYRGESFSAAYHALQRNRREHAASGFDSPD